MLEILDIDWFINLNSKKQRNFLREMKLGKFKIAPDLAKRIGLLFEESKKGFILNESDKEILNYLDKIVGFSVQELYGKSSIPKSTIAYKLARFISYGLVRKIRTNLNGKYRVEYCLTTEGVDYIHGMRPNE